MGLELGGSGMKNMSCNDIGTLFQSWSPCSLSLQTVSIHPGAKEKTKFSRIAQIRHQCRKTTVLSYHRCLIKTGFEKWTTFKYRLEVWPPDVSK